jgi:hypothetical protein
VEEERAEDLEDAPSGDEDAGDVNGKG